MYVVPRRFGSVSQGTVLSSTLVSSTLEQPSTCEFTRHATAWEDETQTQPGLANADFPALDFFPAFFPAAAADTATVEPPLSSQPTLPAKDCSPAPCSAGSKGVDVVASSTAFPGTAALGSAKTREKSVSTPAPAPAPAGLLFNASGRLDGISSSALNNNPANPAASPFLALLRSRSSRPSDARLQPFPRRLQAVGFAHLSAASAGVGEASPK